MAGELKRHYWITGAGSGIGRALADRLAGEGHRVYVSGRNPDKLESLAQSLGGDVIPVVCDVANDQEMAGVLAAHNVEHLDTVILCAGICEYIDMPALDIDTIRRVTETNFHGVVNSCIAALPLLKRQAGASPGERPHIIGVGSMSSYLGFPRAEAYGASKAAMAYFLDALRTDLVGKVDVTVVYPGFVSTPMTDRNDFPMPFLISAEEAASIIIRKASRRPCSIVFPLRLHWLLRVLSWFPGLWYSFISPRLSRSAGAGS
jgi:short-subunit dehydrogenase